MVRHDLFAESVESTLIRVTCFINTPIPKDFFEFFGVSTQVSFMCKLKMHIKTGGWKHTLWWLMSKWEVFKCDWISEQTPCSSLSLLNYLFPLVSLGGIQSASERRYVDVSCRGFILLSLFAGPPKDASLASDPGLTSSAGSQDNALLRSWRIKLFDVVPDKDSLLLPPQTPSLDKVSDLVEWDVQQFFLLSAASFWLPLTGMWWYSGS